MMTSQPNVQLLRLPRLVVTFGLVTHLLVACGGGDNGNGTDPNPTAILPAVTEAPVAGSPVPRNPPPTAVPLAEIIDTPISQ